MPARSRAEWRLIFARTRSEKRAKQLVGAPAVRYKSLPEKVRK